MKKYLTITTAMITIMTASTVSAGDSWYDHNGSLVISRSVPTGQRVMPLRIFYDVVRPGLQGLVFRDDNLFIGEVNTVTGEVAGKARIFSVCGTFLYDVDGNFSNGPRGRFTYLVLRGSAPTRYSEYSCEMFYTDNPAVNRNAELLFAARGIRRMDPPYLRQRFPKWGGLE